ncbi:hypothetical protein L1987_54123 [Smallanthus sonchifolius]|uniref:Uncharacterized protein n=1 Tax=Smallanthus sonchifolius TaxID=185202 RepID=A0ACB9E6K6_9ASTR|nr:hypothetical protein L1987_54123 [Smallanthus sonchifolius]
MLQLLKLMKEIREWIINISDNSIFEYAHMMVRMMVMNIMLSMKKIVLTIQGSRGLTELDDAQIFYIKRKVNEMMSFKVGNEKPSLMIWKYSKEFVFFMCDGSTMRIKTIEQVLKLNEEILRQIFTLRQYEIVRADKRCVSLVTEIIELLVLNITTIEV